MVGANNALASRQTIIILLQGKRCEKTRLLKILACILGSFERSARGKKVAWVGH